jgi:hypothetical protein
VSEFVLAATKIVEFTVTFWISIEGRVVNMLGLGLRKEISALIIVYCETQARKSKQIIGELERRILWSTCQKQDLIQIQEVYEKKPKVDIKFHLTFPFRVLFRHNPASESKSESILAKGNYSRTEFLFVSKENARPFLNVYRSTSPH